MAAAKAERRSGPPVRRRAAMSTERATHGLTTGRLIVDRAHIVFVKGVVEASDGLACLFADRGGDLHIAAPESRARELRELLLDLASELNGRLVLSPEMEASVSDDAPFTGPLLR